MKNILSWIAVVSVVLFFIVAFTTGAQAAFGLPSLIDTSWAFDYAVMSLPNGWSVEGVVQSWMDYENSDVIQVKIGGVTYLTHYSNVVLVDE